PGMPIQITPKEFNGSVYLVLDGQISHEIGEKDTIRVRTSDSYLRLVYPPTRQWAETIRRKLNMT
ncbi:hypothetical protein K2X33_13590, partial [bacterium]|nr:hypothetical protein [bacterium]